MITPTPDHLERIARHFRGDPNRELSQPNKGELRFGTRGSLNVNLTNLTWYDHEQEAGGGVLDLVAHETGQTNGQALAWLASELGVDLRDETEAPAKPELVAEYVYQAADGSPYVKVRKWRGGRSRFTQSRYEDGRWRAGVKGLKIPLYRLPELRQAVPHRTVIVCEGEKDADTAAGLGLVATTNVGGAGKWRPHHGQELAGAHVVVIADADKAGRDHAQQVARQVHRDAASVRVVELPTARKGGDLTDWVEDRRKAGTDDATIAGELREHAKATPYYEPPAHEAGDLNLYGEDGLAQLFTKQYADELRFDHHQGRWFRWDGARWQLEETNLAFNLARHTIRDAAATMEPDKAAKLCKASVASAIERLAAADRAHAVKSDVWDRDHMLLGTPRGTVDLRTGRLREARKDEHITRLAAVSPAFGRTPQRWLKFLRDATGHDLTLVRFIQQMAGYCLTGDVSEHALFFLYGPGGNGKSVLLDTLNGILAEYAKTAVMDSFTASAHDKHTTDLAMLRGARLVSVSETEEGRAWAETRIKQLTGGDEITARFMRQDNFTFKPQFKLVIVGNHKPVLRNVDDAVRRRFNIIPFDKKPPEKDPHLAEKLREEWPAILAWMIEGARDWQENGLIRPDAVQAATEEYFEAQDTFGQWLEECCEIGAHEWEAVSKLYQSWSTFADRQGDKPGSQRAFVDKLNKHGFERDRDRVQGKLCRIYRGLSVRFDAAAAGISHD